MLKKITYVVSFCYIFCWKMMFRMFTIKYEKSMKCMRTREEMGGKTCFQIIYSYLENGQECHRSS